MKNDPNQCPKCGLVGYRYNGTLPNGSCPVCDDARSPEPDYNAPSAHERHVAAWEEKRRLS